MSNDDSLSNKFDLIPASNGELYDPSTEPKISHEIVVTNTDAVKDFAQARKAMSDALAHGSRAVQELTDLAVNAQQPEPYAALSGLIGSMATGAKTMMGLHKQLEELASGPDKKQELHNHLHIPPMTTEELRETLKMISGRKD